MKIFRASISKEFEDFHVSGFVNGVRKFEAQKLSKISSKMSFSRAFYLKKI